MGGDLAVVAKVGRMMAQIWLCCSLPAYLCSRNALRLQSMVKLAALSLFGYYGSQLLTRFHQATSKNSWNSSQPSTRPQPSLLQSILRRKADTLARLRRIL